jgi:superfamily II DNA helicase RecQ
LSTANDESNYTISDEKQYLEVLKEKFGHENFKEGQLEAIKTILEDK